jgi:hypothetical protein
MPPSIFLKIVASKAILSRITQNTFTGKSKGNDALLHLLTRPLATSFLFSVFSSNLVVATVFIPLSPLISLYLLK